ncbi:MAG: sel1 repeat family protein [Sedimenticola sp.]|nr:sel1 repeat family protein [Sedimenticola sp.]
MIHRLFILLAAWLAIVPTAWSVNQTTLKEARAGDSEAQFSLVTQYFREKNLEEGAKWMRRAADSGHARAQFGLAELYIRGFAGLPKDPGLAKQWATRAAEQELVEAQMFLSQGEHKGVFGKPDDKAALRWLERAAGNGDQQAQFMWGMALIQGRDVKQDKDAGAHWLLQSARKGHKQAILGLASSYFNGELTPKNPMMGVYLIRVGVEYKLPEAEKAWAAMQKQDEKGTASMDRLVRSDKRGWGSIVDGTQLGIDQSDDDTERQIAEVAQLWLSGKGLVKDADHGMQLLNRVAFGAEAPAPFERLRMTPLRTQSSQLLGRYYEAKGDRARALYHYLRAAAGEDSEGLQRLCELSGLIYNKKTDSCDISVADPGIIKAQIQMLEQWAVLGVGEAFRLLADLHMRSKNNPQYEIAHKWYCAGERHLKLRGVVGTAVLKELSSADDYRKGERLAFDWLQLHPRDKQDKEMEVAVLKQRGEVCR